jgi:hypothetical protein
VAVERFAKSSVKEFTVVGGAFVAATAAVAGATLGLMRSVANQDLGFQLYARRMLMGTEAARKMKMATDALGYSLEEIIWGPPELAERYHQLIKDETAMIGLLGSDKGESAFRRIRDIEFQFTRLTPALQIFGMKLTEDVINKLAGGPMSLEDRMKHFVDWFESPEGFIKISDKLSNVIAPALRGVGNLMGVLWDKAVGAVDALNRVMGWNKPDNSHLRDYFKSHPGGGFDALGPPGSLDSLTGASRTEAQRRQGGYSDSGFQNYLRELFSKHNYIQEIIDAAKAQGIPPAILMAIGKKESGLNPFAPLGSKGEIGEFQLMPSTVEQLQALGVITNPWDPSQNIKGGAYWLKHQPGKDWQEKIKHYNGSGPAADAYGRDVWRNVLRDPTYQPQSFTPSNHVTVHVTSSNATPEDIKRAVQQGIEEANQRAAKQMYARAQGSYA